MKESRKVAWIGQLVVSVCLLSSLAWAQSGRRIPQTPGEKPLVRLETREVLLPLSAWDEYGRNVADLKPRDVVVLEDGQMRPVTDLRHEAANIVLVLDLNNEIGTFKNGPSQRVPRESSEAWKPKRYEILPRNTTREFADNLVAQFSTADHLAIIQYSDKVQLIQDWTQDRDEALASLREKFRAGLKASLYDALMLAVEKLKTRASGRRIIVLVSDGMDTRSRTGRQQVVDVIRQAQVTVFVVSWTALLRDEIERVANWMSSHEARNSATTKRIAELRQHILELGGTEVELRRLAEESGGEMLLPATYDQLVAASREVIREIGAQYTLAYLTERKPSDDNWHRVEVIAARPGLTLRTRERYYAGEESPALTRGASRLN